MFFALYLERQTDRDKYKQTDRAQSLTVTGNRKYEKLSKPEPMRQKVDQKRQKKNCIKYNEVKEDAYLARTIIMNSSPSMMYPMLLYTLLKALRKSFNG